MDEGTAAVQTHSQTSATVRHTSVQMKEGWKFTGINACVNVFFMCVYAEPRTQDSQGGPDEEDEDGDKQGSVHSSREEPEEVLEGEEMLPWRGPGQCAASIVTTTTTISHTLKNKYCTV